MDNLAERLRSTTQLMANVASVPMGVWDRHSNTCLEAVARVERLEAALREISEFVTSSKRIDDWDGWRSYIAGGGGASWPRDAYECILEWVAEEARAALGDDKPL